MVRQAVYHCALNSCFTTFVSRVPLVRECCMLVFRYCAHYCKMAGYRDHFCISSLLTFYANHFLSQSPLWALSSFGVGCVRGFPSLRRAGALANIAAFLYAFVWSGKSIDKQAISQNSDLVLLFMFSEQLLTHFKVMRSVSNHQLLLVYIFFFFQGFYFMSCKTTQLCHVFLSTHTMAKLWFRVYNNA